MNGINRDLIREHDKKFWTFRNFIIIMEGFNSVSHYKKWLSEMNKEDRNNTNNYYKEKYSYILKIADCL